MQRLKGRLLYMGLSNRPWKLVTDFNETDLWPLVNVFLSSLNGKCADHKQEQDSYTLAANENSEFKFNYFSDRHAILQKTKGVGMSNVYAYLDDALIWLSGRMVEIEIENGKRIKFIADESEKVYGVYFVNGNSCEIPDGAEKTVCKIGQRDCCIFPVAGAGGFQCTKLSSSARTFLDNLAKGRMRASRIGNCTVLGRKEP